MIRLYEAYEDACRRNGVVDFAELLLRSHELLRRTCRICSRTTGALPPRAGGRVPGHQHDPVLLAADCWSARHGMPVRGRRRRPVDLPLARRQGREPAAVPARLPGRAAVPPGAELPLDRHDPGRRERDHRAQQRPHRQEALDRGRQGRADPALPRVQRARRGGVRREPHPRLGLARRQPARRPPSCIVPTRSRACSRNTCSRRASPIASTAACGSSSARRSRTRSRTCA